jgi:hypothetical protein
MSRRKSEEITVEVTAPPTPPAPPPGVPPGLEAIVEKLREAVEKLNQTITLFLSTIAEGLSTVAEGLRTKPYNRHIFTVAPEPITFTGAVYDLGFEVDKVIVIPTINAKIEFNQPVTDKTPALPAGSVMSAKHTRREIHYKSENEGETGILKVWAFWWD